MITNEEVTSLVWSKRRRAKRDANFHDHVAQGLEAIMKEVLERKCLDNISLLLIAFDNFERSFQEDMSPPDSASAKARLKQLNTVTETEFAPQLNLPATTTASRGGRSGRKYVHLTKQLSQSEVVEALLNQPPQRKSTAKGTNNQPASYRLPSREKSGKELGGLSESHRSTGKVTVSSMIGQRK